MIILKDAKYLVAYVTPLFVYLGLSWGGWWAHTTPVLFFAVLPFLELFTKISKENIAESQEEGRSARTVFDLLLYLNVFFVFSLTYLYLQKITSGAYSLSETIGNTTSVGILLGANGINVAHELGHRVSKFEQFLAKLLLMPSLYMHFNIEHNLGHHKNVATPNDPATAKMDEPLYSFWLRAVPSAWMQAWKIERKKLEKTNTPFFSFQNEMLRFQVIQILWLSAITLFFSAQAAFFAIAIAIISFLLLESVNYIEHYGLLRKKLPSGRYEPVGPEHSWNSDHEFGRIFLYELTRHSDHHFKATRKYQILRHFDESPQLPYGYPGSIVLAFFPPLWFKIMNPLAQKVAQQNVAA